jgi:stage II sporulation protein R
MFKLLRLALTFLMIICAFLLGGVLVDRQNLSHDVIRMHVVAASDSEEDQQVKLQIRDAVVACLQEGLDGLESVTDAKLFVAQNLEKIEKVSNEVLEKAGFSHKVKVEFCKEAFEKRVYDTFTLPAGVYEALRITVGEGEGKNWWCVVFPGLCMPKTPEKFEDVAVSAGFSDSLTDTLSNDEVYPVRFFLLECLGRLQNFFFAG